MPGASDPARRRRGRRAPATLPDPRTLPRPWLAAYPPGVPPTYDYPAVPLTRFLDDAARDFPSDAATHALRRRVSYHELREQVDHLAGALLDLGIVSGDRVAVVLPALPALPLCLFATWRIGATAVLVDPDRGPDALAAELAEAGCVATICTPEAAAAVAAGGTQHVVATRGLDWLPFPRNRLARLTRRHRRTRGAGGVRELRDLLGGSAPPASQAPVAATADAAVLAVGTAQPVVLTHRQLVAATFQARLWIPDTQAGKERLLSDVPAWQPAGLVALLTAALSAATLVLDPGGRPLAAVVARSRPTLLYGSPDSFRRLVEEADRGDLTSLRACLATGTLAQGTVERFARASGGARLRETYAPAPAGLPTHANPIYGRSRRGSAGLPVTDTVACVVDPDDLASPQPPGRPGRLLVRGPQVGGDATAEVGDGWLVTADLAVADDEGCFDVLGPADGPGARRLVEVLTEPREAPGSASA